METKNKKNILIDWGDGYGSYKGGFGRIDWDKVRNSKNVEVVSVCSFQPEYKIKYHKLN